MLSDLFSDYIVLVGLLCFGIAALCFAFYTIYDINQQKKELIKRIRERKVIVIRKEK